jgi:hypothetical protein
VHASAVHRNDRVQDVPRIVVGRMIMPLPPLEAMPADMFTGFA